MDTSEKYIEMCEKATEIQNDKKWWNMGDFIANALMPGDTDIKRLIMVADHNIGRMPDLIWLPRQDQLQEMIKIPTDPFNGVLLGKFYRWYNETKSPFNTFEKHWLAFVMEKIFNKKWRSDSKGKNTIGPSTPMVWME
jgi:hypothetical protein